MRVTFTTPFDFSPAALGGRVTIAYPAGLTCSVTRECAEQAFDQGKAVKSARKGHAAGEGA